MCVQHVGRDTVTRCVFTVSGFTFFHIAHMLLVTHNDSNLIYITNSCLPLLKIQNPAVKKARTPLRSALGGGDPATDEHLLSGAPLLAKG